MSFFDVLELAGGLSLFLFGMSTMGTALEKRAGNRLKLILAKLTSNPWRGFLLGLVVTAIIQSSSATTVMIVGFVNSGVMQLGQSISIIMGANVGTAVTSWILSLTGIESGNFFVQLFKPTSLAPICGFIGIVIYMMARKQKRKDTAAILLGFAVLMFGMNIMSAAVAPLKDVPEFSAILLKFSNPILGVLAGTVLTAIIQSSSASVGILQALTLTGGITYATAIPIIMGQNIGTCVTALISSIGTTRDARRASMVHLYFNLIGTAVWLTLFYAADAVFKFAFVSEIANPLGIAVVHTIFKILSTALLMPFGRQLEKLVCMTVEEGKQAEELALLDERLFLTPAIAIDHAREISGMMAIKARDSMFDALNLVFKYDEAKADAIVASENKVDMYEDKIGSYLVKLASSAMAETDSMELTKLLHMIGDLERISDHSVNIMESAREMHEKELNFSPIAKGEITAMINAVREILTHSMDAFLTDDMNAARMVEPLEETIDTMRDAIKARHIERLTLGECTIEMGFVLSDLLTNLERVADHCSNVAMCLMEASQNRFDIHGYQRDIETAGGFSAEYAKYLDKYMPEELKEVK